MLDVSPSALWEEANEAIEYNKRRVAALRAMVDNYRTPWHKGFTSGESFSTAHKFDSRNHPFEYIALTIAQSVFDNPKWMVTARRGYAAEVDAPALREGLNAWTKEVRLKKKLASLYVDYCFHSCMSMTTLEDVVLNRKLRSGEIQRRRPNVRRIGSTRGFRDHRCFELEEARFTGHIFIRDIEDLKKEDGWDEEVLRNIPLDSGIREVRGEEDQHNTRSRKEIAFIEMWVPEYELPDDDSFWDDVPEEERDNYHGTIFTLPLLGFGGDPGVARFPIAPRPWYGNRFGPYQFGGTYPVPDDVMPLSTLIAVEGQNRQNNEVARALYDAIVDYKKIILTSSKNPGLGSAVKRARHGSVLPANLQDLARMVAQIEVGGPTPALLQSAMTTQDTLDRSSGMTDAMRGNVTGSGTAFENSLAAAGANARTAFPKQQFMDFVGDIGLSAAWFMHTADDVVIDLDGGSGAMLGGPPKAHAEEIMKTLAGRGIPEEMAQAFIEFSQKQYENTPFEAFGFSVEPMSTERASDPANRMRIATVMPMVMQLAQMAPAMPWMNVKEMLSTVGQAFDLPDLHRMIDVEKAAQMAQQQQSLAAGPQSAPVAPGSQSARLASDLRGPVGGSPGPQGMRATPYRGPGQRSEQARMPQQSAQPKQVPNASQK